MAESVVTLRVDASGATRALQGVQKRTNALEKSFGGLKTAIAGIGIGLIAKNAVKAATDFEKLNQRLKILTTENGTYAESLKLAEQAQTKFGLSSIDALEGVTNLQARLGPLGSTMDEITAIFNGFNTAAILSGASAQEQAGAMRQLTQALGSGVLRGDEFNSISEQMSAVLAPIAKQLDVNVGALRDMAAQGKITKDVVVAAFKEIERDGSAALKQLIANDPTMVFKVLSNETEKLSIAVGTLLAPAILDGVTALTKLTTAATKFVNSPIGKTAAIFAAIAIAAKGVAIAIPLISAALIKVAFAGGLATIALNAIPFVAVATGIGAIVTQLIKQRQEQDKVTQAIKDGEVAQLRALESDLSIKMAKEFAIIQSSNDKRSINAAERRLALLREQYVPLRKRLDTVIKENAVEKEKNKTIKENKDIQEEINKLIKDNLEKAIAYEQAEMDSVKAKGKLIDRLSDQRALAQAALNGNLKEVQTQQEINALVAIHGEGLRDVITAYIKGTEALKKQKEEADELKHKFDEIGEAIESSIKNNLRDAITGAQSFGQAMTNVLNRIRDKIIDAQLDRLIGGFSKSFGAGASGGERKGLGGFLGGILGGLFRENGGPVKAGQPYIVGERQPELFVPRTSGTILPSVPTGGGGTTNNMITVNVDASGTSVQGSGSEADQLGGLIASVVQATIIDEQRAGGLLNR